MPIVKCPKCGKEYDSMYSFHQCQRIKERKPQKTEKQREKWWEGWNIGEILGMIFTLIIIGALIWNFLVIFDVVEPPGGYIEEKEFYETDQNIRCFMGFCF